MDKKADLAIANQTLQTELTCQRVTQVLQEEIDRLTAILNTVSALVVVLDPEGYIVRFNYACEQFTGYTFDEVRDKPLWDVFLSQNEKESVKAVFSSIQVDSRAIAKENDWVLKDGSHRRIAWSYAPLLDTSGALKYVVGTGTNITSRKQPEEALRTLHEELESRVQERTMELAQANAALRAEISERKRAEEALRISETRFRTIFEQSPLSMQILAPDGRTLQVNQAWEELFGLTLANVAEYIMLEDRQLVDRGIMPYIEKGFAGEAMAFPPVFYDSKQTFHEGRSSWTQAFMYPVKDAEGNFHEVVLMHQDITSLKQAEQLARVQREALTRTLNLLATEPELDKFLGHLLTTLTEQLSQQQLAPSSTLWFYDPATNILSLHMTCYKGHILIGELTPGGTDGVPTTCNVTGNFSWNELVRTQQPIILNMNDVSHHPGFKEWHPWLLEQGVKALLVAPLLRGKEVIGTMTIFNTKQDYYEPEEIQLAQALAGQASLAVQLTRLAEQGQQSAVLEERNRATQQRAAELTKVNDALRQTLAELDRVNQALRVEVTERRRAEQVSRGQTATLVKTLTVLAAEPVLDNFLGYVLQAIAEQLGERSGGIWLYDEAYDTTILHIDYEDGQIRRGEQILRPGASKQNVLRQWDTDYMQLLREKKVLIQDIQDLPKSPAYAQSRAYNKQRGIRTILVVSLFFGENFLGNITLRSTQRRDYKAEELELARVLAYQASLAIQLTRLAEQAQQSAVLEERNRLAREIHDTLAQVLTGIVVQLQAAENVHTTDPSDRQAHVTTARLLAKEGLTEARHSVRALRSHALEDTDLAGALANLTQQMATGTGLQAVCHVCGTPYLLPPDVESNLLRIGQEAFTNTLKHACAGKVEIELVYKPGQVRLLVQDNGQGFDPDLPPTEGYGLIGMRERAQNIGAELTITSQPGYGTEVVVTVPLFSSESKRSNL